MKVVVMELCYIVPNTADCCKVRFVNQGLIFRTFCQLNHFPYKIVQVVKAYCFRRGAGGGGGGERGEGGGGGGGGMLLNSVRTSL